MMATTKMDVAIVAVVVGAVTPWRLQFEGSHERAVEKRKLSGE